jgi:hypothetical protein
VILIFKTIPKCTLSVFPSKKRLKMRVWGSNWLLEEVLSSENGRKVHKSSNFIGPRVDLLDRSKADLDRSSRKAIR